MSGIDLLIIGRQVYTDHGGYIDLLGLDVDGRAHVLELKRDRTPRDVVAQTLDYGSWVSDLSLADLEQVYADHRSDHADPDGDHPRLDEAFAEHFGNPLPDVVNTDQQFTIVASELDPASDRIVEFLAESYDVPINAVFFRHFSDEGRDYLARTWLLDRAPTDDESARPSRRARGSHSKSRPWNGQDFYVVLGNRYEPERWPIARRYGLLSAGGGSRYVKPLGHLTPGKRVFAYVGQAGYVGIGLVTGTMILAGDAKVEVDGELRPLLDQPDCPWEGPDGPSEDNGLSADPYMAEWVVPVKWIATRSLEEAVPGKGLFTSPHIVCKLRDEHTIKTVEQALGLDP